jgi:hypothetical protein
MSPALSESSGSATERVSTLIAIAIGVVTLTGAYLTWRSVNLSGNASGADRQAVIDTITQQKAAAFAQSELRFELGYFARYHSDVVAAEQLDKAADAASNKGQDDAADVLSQQAESYRVLASSVLASGVVPNAYVSGDKGDNLTFDDDRRLRDLQRSNPYVQGAPSDPNATVKGADKFHDRSLRLVAFVVGLAAVIVLFTFAQLSRPSRRRLLVGVASAGYVVFTVLALVGDKA